VENVIARHGRHWARQTNVYATRPSTSCVRVFLFFFVQTAYVPSHTGSDYFTADTRPRERRNGSSRKPRRRGYGGNDRRVSVTPVRTDKSLKKKKNGRISPLHMLLGIAMFDVGETNTFPSPAFLVTKVVYRYRVTFFDFGNFHRPPGPKTYPC